MVVTQEDIELAGEVYKYPALYDKSSCDYHKTEVKNCWVRVARVIGLESSEIANKRLYIAKKKI